jgi:glutamine synthetase
VVKEVALRHGAYASFMPKPLEHVNGSGMHTHMSLFKGENNAFYSAEDPDHLSGVARCFVAGLMRHAPEITAVTNQWVNSYKRLVPGYEAPVYISWTQVNRSDLIRVPSYKPGFESSIRVEYRVPDPACNPYLALSAMLAAGLRGIQEGYEVPSPVVGNVLEMTPQRRQSLGIRSLPASLGEAITLAENSELLHEALGDHVFTSLIQNKKMEWEEYRSTVTDYEVSRYLPAL